MRNDITPEDDETIEQIARQAAAILNEVNGHEDIALLLSINTGEHLGRELTRAAAEIDSMRPDFDPMGDMMGRNE